MTLKFKSFSSAGDWKKLYNVSESLHILKSGNFVITITGLRVIYIGYDHINVVSVLWQNSNITITMGCKHKKKNSQMI